MALINCPVCGKQVSDRGTDCIHCGSSLIVKFAECPECGNKQAEGTERCEVCGCPLNIRYIPCPDCGKEIPEGTMRCDACGCPIEEITQEPVSQTVSYETYQSETTYPIIDRTDMPIENDSNNAGNTAKKYNLISAIALFVSAASLSSSILPRILPHIFFTPIGWLISLALFGTGIFLYVRFNNKFKEMHAKSLKEPGNTRQ